MTLHCIAVAIGAILIYLLVPDYTQPTDRATLVIPCATRLLALYN